MLSPAFDCERLIAPVSPQHFRQEYWEQRPLWVRRENPSYFSELFCSADLDGLLLFTRPVPPEVHLVRNQEELSPRVYVEQDGRFNLNQVHKAFDDGYSVTFNDLHRFWQPAAQLCGRLENLLRFRCKANLYLTPGRAVALKPHFDTHEVLVLQIEGRKRWKLYDSFQRVPLVGSFQPVLSPQQLGPPSMDVLLEPGDTLYVPRGFVHDVATEDDASLHWTIGIYPNQWCDLLKTALTVAGMEHESLRRALPWGSLDDQEQRQALREQFVELARLLVDETLLDKAVALSEYEFLAQSVPAPDGHFAQLLDWNRLSQETIVAYRDAMRCRTLRQGIEVLLQFPGNSIRGPMALAETFAYVAGTPRFAIGSLPGGLTDDAKLMLVRRLIRGGLLRVDQALASTNRE